MLSNTQKERDDLLQALAAQRALTLKREQELAAVRFENRALRHEQKSFASSFPGTAQLLGALSANPIRPPCAFSALTVRPRNPLASQPIPSARCQHRKKERRA